MLNIKQFRSGDNLSYVLFGDKEALAIDGVAAQAILDFIESRGLSLTLIANTHSHLDHTGGNNALLKNSKATSLRVADLIQKGEFELEGQTIKVFHTPGHTEDSICFYTPPYLISGDTLFNGTIGNCFTGDLRAFHESIKKLMILPPDTIVYAGHDYVKDSRAFANYLEPGNNSFDLFLKQRYDPAHVYSTLNDELSINPYLRFNDDKIIAVLESRGLTVGTGWHRWESLMSIE
ncbi:MAG: MBL fold metallo-hydrolase [Deltaproteobacteria bacterium]|nr:MBL fold metallo-hydrolase [Deltaproteobacteria bacterium]